MKLGIAADHGGFDLKQRMATRMMTGGHTLHDFGATELDPQDDFPNYVIPLARAVARGEVDRGIAICGSGVGASVAANKVAGVRAALITDYYSAHQGVEDDNMNLICLGGRVVGQELAWELVQAFLTARFSGEERFIRRLAEVSALER
ncbi:MAG: RpiB/LacA/LacB family sugar-phosphate isomerase [Anaerolineaceae bacterium]|nr:RpiB/LacA/LacB family sugar-phosphate isomerase [Anaerolineaceae bacterium]